MKRKVWSTGNKIIHTLPKEWGEMVIDKYKGEIEEVVLDKKIILTLPHEKKTTIRISSDAKDILELKMKIDSAYIDGYDFIEVPVNNELLRKLNLKREEFKEKIQSFIPAMCIASDSSTYVLEVHDEFYSLNYIFEEKIKKGLRELSKGVKNSLRFFPKKEEIEDNETYVKELEREIDYTLFRIRRAFNKALESADLCERLGIKNDKDIISLYTIFTYYERITDLHSEVISMLKEMLNQKDAPGLKLDAFLKVYDRVYETVETSLEALKDAQKALELILKKEKLENGEFPEERKEVEEFIEKQDNKPLLVRDLTILEGKILAIPYLSINICELAYNMNRAAWLTPEKTIATTN
jgi:hypothetical protein